MRYAALLVVTVALTGCTDTGERAEADCQAQVRGGETVYTSYGMTDLKASPAGMADRAECDDVGEGAGGSTFPEDPEQVRAWVFDDFPPEKVVGVRYGEDELGVFISDDVQPDERERIHAQLTE
ncbi:MAG: DUF6281 family protein [Nocardioides sp.]|uniref:DUF6281 family protein n=1 Tax=Nocardioides sp. TaxID=35761 RepID=UPI003F09B82A